MQPPSATLVVKGLSQRTMEDDLYEALVGCLQVNPYLVVKHKVWLYLVMGLLGGLSAFMAAYVGVTL